MPCSNELICWSANCRNLMNGFSDFDWDLFESFSGSEDEAISHSVLSLGPATFELEAVDREAYDGGSSSSSTLTGAGRILTDLSAFVVA